MRHNNKSVVIAMRRTLALTGLSLALCAPAAAGVDIPDVPIEIGAVVPSNLMYILDDSGSMMWDVMPDNEIYPSGATLGNLLLYMFPLPQNGTHPYAGNTTYNKRVPEFRDDNLHSYYLRSAHNNTNFYNPEITYVPWARHDGTSFGNANPAAAPYNPAYAAPGTLNLTVQQNHSAEWRRNITSENLNSTPSSCGGNATCQLKYWPITFYVYKGSGATTSASSYVRYQIRGASGYRKELPGGAETPVAGFTWPGGITRSVLDEQQNFANWFTYHRSRILAARGGTSLAFAGLSSNNFRVGFRTINNYSPMDIPITGTFSGTNRSTWFNRLFTTPINAVGTPLRTSLRSVGEYYSNSSNSGPWGPAPQIECRRSFAILTSDGYWNDSFSGVGNADGTAGSTITGPDNQSYQYTAERPYRDGFSDTLADVAMHYWKRDLRSNLANRLTPTPTNPAFWQHMSTFTIGLGLRGTLDPDNDLPDLTSGAKAWPNPATVEPGKLDDLWHAAVNGRGVFVAARDGQEFAKGLKKALDAIGREGAVMNVAVTSAMLTTDAKAFRARYDGTWAGDLEAFSVDPHTNRPATNPSWSAAEKLDEPLSHTGRNIWTRSGGTAQPFEWNSLGSPQKAALNNDEDVLEYLRGERGGETSAGGEFRTRSSRLGDMVNSSPVYVSETRTVYIGANDGMLHGFDASNGEELFAYVPENAYTHLAELADPNYSHRFFVDGDLVVSTRSQGGGKNILVGSLGRGGKALFALDVTNPASFGANNVLWEVKGVDAYAELGQVVGKPVIAKLNNGKMAVMVGNGYNSADDKAALLLIDLHTGALIKRISTGVGSAGAPNGLAQPVGWDVDGDGKVDTAYAGDLHGNLWRFDLSGGGSGAWKLDGKLFQAVDAASKAQPITGTPAVAANPNNGDVWVVFGSGRFLSYDDKSNTDVQTWYGVIDDGGDPPTRGDLYQRKVEYITTKSGRRVRTFSVPDDEVAKEKAGWYIDWTLPGGGREGERVVSRTQYIGGVVVVSSIIPEDDPCKAGGRSWLNQVNPFIGHFSDRTFFDINDDGRFDDDDLITRDGKKLPANSSENPHGMIREVTIIGKRALTGGDDVGVDLNVPEGRISWQEFVNN